jgi:predicted LPLAT superfamily acyltransferase
MTHRWTDQKERGSPALLRLMAKLTLALGWRFGRAMLVPITCYFFVALPRARASSRRYLSRCLGRPAAHTEVWRHLFVFASVILDRVFMLADRMESFQVDTQGLDILRRLHAKGTGCVLLGAHFGSYDVLRVIGRSAPVRVRPLMYRDHWGATTHLLETLDPALADAIIEIGRPDTMLRVQESVSTGEIVGILADRAPAKDRFIQAPFFGQPAPFPTGPFVVAALTQVPVILFYGVRTGPRRYAIRFELFAERLSLNRATRQADLACAISRYARNLEAACRASPFNWFNFYDFWAAPSERTQDEAAYA